MLSPQNTSETPSTLDENGRAIRRSSLHKSLRATVATTATIAALMLAGTGVYAVTSVLADRADATSGPPPEPPVGVATKELVRVPGYSVTRRFVGTVEPVRSTEVAFELPGVMEAVFVDEGDTVEEGELVARIDTSILEADRDRLQASIDALGARLELARRTLTRQKELNARGHASDQRLDEIALSEAELTARISEARAALAGIELRIDKSEIRAPFDGRVADRFHDDGAIVGAGQPVVRVLEDTRPRVRVGVEPGLADQMTVGQPIEFHLAGQSIPAVIERLTPDLDIRTRTRTVLLSLDVEPADAVGLYGRTGTMEMNVALEERGAWVPIDAIREGARGTWTVLTLMEADAGVGQVSTEAVEIIHTEGDRVFVRGTFEDGVSLVVTGTHRIVPGQDAIDLDHPEADALLLALADRS